MLYQKAVIYFSSGTGNSYRIAEWFNMKCKKQNITTRIIPIDKAKPKEDIESSDKTIIAFIYPTHLVMPSWSIIKFLIRMPVKKGTHFICMPTRGSFPIKGKWIFPGGAGFALFLPWIILPFKGYNLRGGISFDMPFNHLYFVPHYSKKGLSLIFGKAKQKADKTFEKLFSEKLIFFTPSNLLDLFWALLPLVLFPTLLVGYLLLGRLFQTKLLFANTKCTGCGICAKSCPTKAIKIIGKKHPLPFWNHKCDNCLRCMAFCKNIAIEAGHSWALILVTILILISNIPISVFLVSLLNPILPNTGFFNEIYIIKFINLIIYYLTICFAYDLLHCFIRFKTINKIFTYTTFSHFRKRYREPGTKLTDLVGK
jgi:ferredoxin